MSCCASCERGGPCQQASCAYFGAVPPARFSGPGPFDVHGGYQTPPGAFFGLQAAAIGAGSWWAPYAVFGQSMEQQPQWQEVWIETTTALGTSRAFAGHLWASGRQLNDLHRNLGLSRTATGVRDIRICPAGQPAGIGCLTGRPNVVLPRAQIL